MNAALEFKQDPKLSTAYVVEDDVMSERAIKVLEYLTFGSALALFFGGFFVAMISGVNLITSAMYNEEPGSASSWFISGLVYLVVLIPVGIISGKFEKMRYHYYTEVPQGKILSNITRGGGESPLQFCIVVEGYNRMMQVRTFTRAVNAGLWRDGVYVVGEYFDVNEKTSTD